MPKCVVIDPAVTWGEDFPPQVSWADTIIYEAHVKGMTALHPDLPSQIRGTFGGLADPRAIDHLVKLGVTAVELMPIQSFFDDRYLTEKGLSNYWGYNTVGFFSPATRYISHQSDLHEFKLMVRRLHEAGIEVILDVVYNHTAEGNQMGPTLSFRGIDNASYYILADDPRYYFDTTGCGNTVRLGHQRVLQMVMDSLRYWVEECHVDGLRFDLASSLGRERDQFNSNAIFLDAVHQDPVLAGIKLIAEPWDTGPNGYQLGNFPPGWAEWNGQYRDTVRSYWKGDPDTLPGLAGGLLGSSHLFERRGRRPWASINFVTAHDGFTLEDVVSYNDKHNEANQEDNRDGHDDNRSWNCGVEGETTDPGGPRAARPDAPQHDRHRASVAGHADDPDGRRGRPLAGRQQQQLLPGQRDELAAMGGIRPARRGLLRVRPQAGHGAQDAPSLPPVPFPAWQGARRQRPAGRRLAQA